ncbi:Oligopeptide transport ATP-binding protein OppF [bacterium HR26]|nr:Oligopeptide transport ATP-binding protein OppF [bacterium HR26]
MTEPLIALDHVSMVFKARRGGVKAVDDVSLSLEAGEVLCLVGESGSGKTTTGKIVAGLLKPTSGSVRFRGQDIWQMDKARFKAYRRAVQIVHQDPYASLNPIHTVFTILATPLQRHGMVRGRAEAVRRVLELLETVDLTPPESFLFKYPHQLSGGQRQRVSIARALTVNPELIVADEATSMVDVSIRVSLLNTLQRLRDELGVGFLFITHDLAIAKYFAWHGRVAVMYLGRVVEFSPTPALINDPQHPYTRALLAAIPEPDPDLTRRKGKLQLRSLDIPSLLHIPPGCSFHPRCPLFEAGLCDVQRPDLVPIDEKRLVACHVVARERTGTIAKHAASPVGISSDPVIGADLGEYGKESS